mmetsp:Transcript_4657/g.13040  ORF Transcript_4657/g.13040 Transcript_4657/m.13040 type:complete len:80 (-) Transcript_4657:161-400(-)
MKGRRLLRKNNSSVKVIAKKHMHTTLLMGTINIDVQKYLPGRIFERPLRQKPFAKLNDLELKSIHVRNLQNPYEMNAMK